MSNMMIRGSEYPIKKIFSDDFFFTIPRYQRPYSWTTEQSEELFQDLIRAMDNFNEADDNLPPYFLGSILLSKGDESQAEIIDGQQRLTTLTMLLAAIRSLIKSDFAEGLTAFLCEKGNVTTGTPSRYRLRLRVSDTQFFQKYIQEENGVEELIELRESQLPDSQKNIRDNTIGFIRELRKLSQSQLESLTRFIVNRCFLIVVTVSAPDRDSVYRIFSVLNSRGMNLSCSDILKSDIITAIPPDQQDDYATMWDEFEVLLGTEQFEALFYNLRAIFSRKRLNRGVIEEFHEYVFPGRGQTSTPQKFMETVLFPYVHALDNILKFNYQYVPTPNAKSYAKEINSMFKWLDQLDRGNWIAPALYYFVQNHRQRQSLVVRFLVDLERLVVSFMIRRVPPYKRIDRYCQLLEAIYKDEDLFAPTSPLQLTPVERQEVCRILNGDIYQLHYVCRYILLRLDSYRSDSGASYDYQTITIEHILPQRPSPDSKWRQIFSSKEMNEKYVHRLGNLVLLSRGKNMKAENFDFDEKKQKYFFADNVSTPFVLTNEVREYREWTPAIIDQRQRRLIDALQRLWRL
jgi:hypothetical protein